MNFQESERRETNSGLLVIGNAANTWQLCVNAISSLKHEMPYINYDLRNKRAECTVGFAYS